MILQIIDADFSLCKVSHIADIDFSAPYCFVGKTDEELSLVCTSSHVPHRTLECNDGWKAFRIQGTLDFSLIGILSQISTLLAEQDISIYAVSTFNTDYIFTKAECFATALAKLKQNGYTIELLRCT